MFSLIVMWPDAFGQIGCKHVSLFDFVSHYSDKAMPRATTDCWVYDRSKHAGGGWGVSV